ncbi:MAG: hypothetical protein WCG45_03905 [bacterium]
MTNETLEEEKQALIDLVIWYRDEYHKSEFGHNEMIEGIKEAKTSKDLDVFYQWTDSWIDGPLDN